MNGVFRSARLGYSGTGDTCDEKVGQDNHYDSVQNTGTDTETVPASTTRDAGIDIARCLLRLADLNNSVFERLGRYEAALWRQTRQTLFGLQAMRCRTSSDRHGHKIRRRTMHFSEWCDGTDGTIDGIDA
jgi:hypothetical protein